MRTREICNWPQIIYYAFVMSILNNERGYSDYCPFRPTSSSLFILSTPCTNVLSNAAFSVPVATRELIGYRTLVHCFWVNNNNYDNFGTGNRRIYNNIRVRTGAAADLIPTCPREEYNRSGV